MRALAQRYADDPDIAVLAAGRDERARVRLMAADGKPQAWTPQIIAWLDRALRLAPLHPGAHHYRIHLFEDSRQPGRALASAQQLGALAPIVGHLVHMPSHIYFRLGRYRDAVAANDAAVKADRDYAAAAGATSDYAIHNLHFLGSLRSGVAKATSRSVQRNNFQRQSRLADDAHDGTRQLFGRAGAHAGAPAAVELVESNAEVRSVVGLPARLDALCARDGIGRTRRCRRGAR